MSYPGGKLGAVLGVLHLALGLGDGRGQVAVLDAELDGDVAAVVFPVDVGGAGLVWVDLDQLSAGESEPRACRPARERPPESAR